MIIGIEGDVVYSHENLEGYLTRTCFRGFWCGAEICYIINLNEQRSVKLLKSSVKESNDSKKSLRAWMKGDKGGRWSTVCFPVLYLAGNIIGAIVMVCIMIGIVSGSVAVMRRNLFLGFVLILVAAYILWYSFILFACFAVGAYTRLRELRLRRFYRRHQPMRLTLLVNELVDAVADQLRQLETPLSEEGADDPDRAYLKLACTMRADDLEGFVLKNRALIEALEAAHREGIKVPKLERREMKKRLQDGASRIAIQIDTRWRMALEAAQRHQDEEQRQKERKRLHKQSLRRLKEGAVLTQVHAALGWTPDEAATRQAFHTLEEEQAKERAAQAGLLTRGRQLVKQLPSPRKGKKSKRKGKKSKRKGKKSKRGKKTQGKKP